MAVVKAKKLTHSYDEHHTKYHSLQEINLTLSKGEYVVLLGCNGCGKSTLVKHFNVLLPVQSGELTVVGWDAKDGTNVWKIRRKCGMVFQNPDNQFVSSVVAEDIAFGLQNYDVPKAEIQTKIKEVLSLVGMSGYENKAPHLLSGGQKQRIAIAGVLALDPDIMIFDEATAMLDPEGRQDVLATIQRLHKEEKKTVIMITHYIEEAVFADRIVLMHRGRIIADGTPRAVLTDVDLLADAGIMPTIATRAYIDLLKCGVSLPLCPLTEDELVEQLCRLQ